MNLSHDLQGLKKKAKETFLYVLSALLLGIAIGAIDAIFGRVLLFITDFRSAHVVVLLPFLPLAGLGIVWLYRHFNETASKGMTLVMEAGQGKRESIPLALIPLVMAGTWITHLFGGSAGREGVAVQIGATLSHAFARRFHFPDNGRIVLIAGMAAGFGGLFQTPFAAVFFAMEVVVSGSMAYSALLPAAIASFTASATSHALGLEKFSVLLSQTLSLTDTKTVTYLILFGILFGLTGRLFAVLLLAALLAVPFFKLFAYGVLLKAAGALVGIVADKRLVGCIERTADAVFLTLRLAASGAACFLILIAIVICLVRGS